MKKQHIGTRTVEQVYAYIYSASFNGFPKHCFTRLGWRRKCAVCPAMFNTLLAIFDGRFIFRSIPDGPPDPRLADVIWSPKPTLAEQLKRK